jgi:hypothetical protein
MGLRVRGGRGEVAATSTSTRQRLSAAREALRRASYSPYVFLLGGLAVGLGCSAMLPWAWHVNAITGRSEVHIHDDASQVWALGFFLALGLVLVFLSGSGLVRQIESDLEFRRRGSDSAASGTRRSANPEISGRELSSGEFLVGYDHGLGGLWGVLLAVDRAAIRARFPELTVVDRRPDWMTLQDLEHYRARPLRLDDDPQRGPLLALTQDRDL